MQNSLLGPSTYLIETGDFTEPALAAKAQGPNWERAHDMEKFNAIPHMLYREKWAHKKELVSAKAAYFFFLNFTRGAG